MLFERWAGLKLALRAFLLGRFFAGDVEEAADFAAFLAGEEQMRLGHIERGLRWPFELGQHAVEFAGTKAAAPQPADKGQQHRRALRRVKKRAGDFAEKDPAFADRDILIDDRHALASRQQALQFGVREWPDHAQARQANFFCRRGAAF